MSMLLHLNRKYIPQRGFIVLFLVVVSWCTTTWGQQEITIQLTDTLLVEKKVSFVSRKFRADYGLIHRLDGSFYTPLAWKTYSLTPSHFFWSNQFDDKAYHEVLFALDTEKGEHHLFVGSSKDTVLTEVGILSASGANEIDITFTPVKELDKSTVRVSVSIEVNKHGELVFFPNRILKGYLVLQDTVLNFHVWPYQMGPTIAIETGGELRLTATEIAYRTGEPFVFGNQVIRFDGFDYTQKILTAHTEPLEGNERLEGYKVGYYLSAWNTGFIDALGIQRDQPFMLYFGGSWCPPCLEELPRWKRIATVCEKYGVGTVSVAVLYKESPKEAKDYLTRHVFPEVHIIEDISSKDATLRELLAINSFPTYVFIDSTGKILMRVENRGDRDTVLPSFLSKYISAKQR